MAVQFVKPERGQPDKVADPSFLAAAIAATPPRAAFASMPGNYQNTFIESQPSLNGGVDVRFGSVDVVQLLTNVLPRTKQKRLERASWFGDHDDFLNGIIKIKKKFGARGFSLNFAQPGTMLMDAKQGEAVLKQQSEAKEMLRKLAVQRNLYGIVKELMRCWYTYDSMIMYWRVEDAVGGETPSSDLSPVKPLANVKQIMAFDPKDCQWCNDQLQDQLLWRMPDEMFNRIRNALAKRGPLREVAVQALLADNIPATWIESVSKGQQTILLKHEEGHYWIVRTDGPEQCGLASPSMFTVFIYLEMRRALREGDFIAAYMMKHFIQHVTLGESITQGPMAGSQNNWPTLEEIAKMHTIFKESVKAARLITNHTVQIKYVHPPAEMFATGKYIKPEDAVMHWASMTGVLVHGEGANNSGGYIGLKRVITDLEDCRTEIDQIFQLFFDHESIRSTVGAAIPDTGYVSAEFDQNVLKEPRQLLEEIKMLVSQHWMGAETAMQETGRDPNKVRMEKQIDQIYNENTDVYEPLSQAPVGTMPSGGGRPPNNETTQDEGTRRQTS